MDWLDAMRSAMDYIESNLDGEISIDAIARLACCSSYHFQRMFPFVTGVTLSEYIRRRRLTLAAFDLQSTGAKIIDVAMKYGYESPEAFARAFKKQHGVQPMMAKNGGIALKAYPRMTFHLSIKGDVEMKYRIEQREAFEVFGAYTVISTDQEEAFVQVPAFFKQCDDDGATDAINDLLGRFHDNYTISALYDHTESSAKYMLCNYKPKDLPIPDRFTTLAVPAANWVVFTVPDCDMQAMWRRIWTEWFPTSGYDSDKGAQFEMYYGLARHENGFSEIWIPVKKK